MSNNAIKPIDEVRRSLLQMKEQIKAALPPQVDTDRFIRVTITALQNAPKLLEVNRHSLYNACMKAAQSGLLPDGSESAIVPFKDQAQFMPMIKGILKQVRNSGELLSITSMVIFKNDKFKYWVDHDGEHLVHEPNFFGDRGEQIGVYGIAKTKDGGVYIEVMTSEQVSAVRNVSRAKDGPWDGPFGDEMARKTVLRRLSKRLPMSTDLEGLMKADDDLFMPPEPTSEKPGDAAAPAPEKKTSKTAKLVAAAIKKDDPPVAGNPSDSECATTRTEEPPKHQVKNHAPQATVTEDAPPL